MSRISFFEKNKCDFSDSNVTATASQGAAYAIRALNRSNMNAWITTGSEDADNTTFTVTLADPRKVSKIFLLKHNFKNYVVEYHNGTTWAAFSPAISETNDAKDSSVFDVTEVEAHGFRITIYGTQIPDSEKFLYQFIATRPIGILGQQPKIANFVRSRNASVTRMISGKYSVRENVGNVQFDLDPAVWYDAGDLTIIEQLYRQYEGFLVWLCGGDESQFGQEREGYRIEDIYLMKCRNEIQPDWNQGLFGAGLKFKVQLAEVVD